MKIWTVRLNFSSNVLLKSCKYVQVDSGGHLKAHAKVNAECPQLPFESLDHLTTYDIYASLQESSNLDARCLSVSFLQNCSIQIIVFHCARSSAPVSGSKMGIQPLLGSANCPMSRRRPSPVIASWRDHRKRGNESKVTMYIYIYDMIYPKRQLDYFK